MIKLENVSKYYYSKTSVTQALRNINLEFKLGEFVAITGESGSGKTTLLNVISGIDTYEDGDIYFNDTSISAFDDKALEKFRKENIAFIFQNNNLIDSYTVLKNVESALVIQGLSKKERIIKAKEIIEKVGLTSRIKHRATKLSGGEKQRLAIARALAKDTSIIIADEPTGSLDSKTGDQILELLSQLSKDKLVLIVTHNYPQIEQFVTRKIRVFNGEIVEDLNLREFKEVQRVIKKHHEIKETNKAVTLSLFNFFGHPNKSLFIILISFVLVFFVFSIYSYILILEDPSIQTMNYVNSYPERLVVKRQDGNALTKDDYDFFNKDRRIEKVIKEDVIIDSQLNINLKTDNGFWYSDFKGYYNHKLSEVKPNKLYGRMPIAPGEIVISKFLSPRNLENTISIINSNKPINAIFNDLNMRINFEMKIVGVILSEDDKDLYYTTDETIKLIKEKFDNENISMKLLVGDNTMKLFFNKNSIFIDPKLEGFNVISYQMIDDFRPLSEYKLTIGGNEIKVFDHPIREETNYYKVFVSKELYDQLFPINTFIEEHQYTLHLKNKYDHEVVSKKLLKNGYDVYSPFYDNAFSLDEAEALNAYFISVGTQTLVYVIILIVYLFSYLIYKIILRTKVRDYVIFKVLGANNKLIKKTIYFEFVFSFLFAYILFFLVYLIIKDRYEILEFYRLRDYIAIILINTILSYLIVRLYLGSLKKKSIFNNLRGLE